MDPVVKPRDDNRKTNSRNQVRNKCQKCIIQNILKNYQLIILPTKFTI
ncbi:MAG: hypothetical protein ACEY3D_00265 [Rickettsia sp.]